jgi:hypothetical protein
MKHKEQIDIQNQQTHVEPVFWKTAVVQADSKIVTVIFPQSQTENNSEIEQSSKKD